MDKVLVVGDSNVDVTMSWDGVEKRVDELSPEYRKLLMGRIKKVKTEGVDLEHYYSSMPEELSSFFDSFESRVEMGGCGAIKSCVMAHFSRAQIHFWSKAGKDENGELVKKALMDAGVNMDEFIQEGFTYKTYNLFHPGYRRLAFSSWSADFDIGGILDFIEKEEFSKIFLSGAHRLPDNSLGYGEIAAEFPDKTYVFTGSFAAYSEEQLKRKYENDLGGGILVSNDAEAVQIAQALGFEKVDPLGSLNILKNKYIVMHGSYLTAIKRGNEVITSPTQQTDEKEIKELTGIGDVWESVFLSQIESIEKASEEQLITAQQMASIASHLRMCTCKLPSLDDLRKLKFVPHKEGTKILESTK